MSDEEYLETQAAVIAATSLVAGLDLTGFLARISAADAAGPVLDPTLYRVAAPAMRALRDLARAMLEVQRAANRPAALAALEASHA